MTFDQQTHQFQLSKELERLIQKMERDGSNTAYSEVKIINYANSKFEDEPKTAQVSMVIMLKKI